MLHKGISKDKDPRSQTADGYDKGLKSSNASKKAFFVVAIR